MGAEGGGKMELALVLGTVFRRWGFELRTVSRRYAFELVTGDGFLDGRVAAKDREVQRQGGDGMVL